VNDGSATRTVPVLNIANALTGVRIVLIPVFALLVVASSMTEASWRIAACAVFFAASITDYMDGWIARTWDLVTPFGKVADPIADKALTGTALLLLSAYGRLAWWVTAVILIREWGVTALRFWVLRHGVIPASRGGKAKTALQILAITWCLWPFAGLLADIGGWLMALAVIVTVVTGIDYVMRAVRLRRSGLALAISRAAAAIPGPGVPGSAVPGPSPSPPGADGAAA
jgi:CDP-diacylglycerol--glycerol-3-phosphate 3-phosphatidyltransferase